MDGIFSPSDQSSILYVYISVAQEDELALQPFFSSVHETIPELQP
jgi:hypothetical protein